MELSEGVLLEFNKLLGLVHPPGGTKPTFGEFFHPSIKLFQNL
jgi:hypothetical protein